MAKDHEIKPVVINTLSDIKGIIAPLLEAESSKPIEIRVEMEWTNEKGKRGKGWSSAKSADMSSHEVLLGGFNEIKTRIEMMEKAKVFDEVRDEDDDLLPERIRWGLIDVDNQFFSVDTFVKNRLGGKRKGLRIRWEIEEGIFEFDPYTHKLFQVDENE